MVEPHEVAHDVVVLFVRRGFLSLLQELQLRAVEVEAVRAGDVVQLEVEVAAVADEKLRLHLMAEDRCIGQRAQSHMDDLWQFEQELVCFLEAVKMAEAQHILVVCVGGEDMQMVPVV